jgi:hypothetical protein
MALEGEVIKHVQLWGDFQKIADEWQLYHLSKSSTGLARNDYFIFKFILRFGWAPLSYLVLEGLVLGAFVTQRRFSPRTRQLYNFFRGPSWGECFLFRLMLETWVVFVANQKVREANHYQRRDAHSDAWPHRRDIHIQRIEGSSYYWKNADVVRERPEQIHINELVAAAH